MEYRTDLQGLRALAVALVILAHADIPGFAGGFIGVDVFFVLSGYLISRMLIREKLRTGRIALAAFYARRLRRLLPAMLCMIGVTAVAANALLSGQESSAMLGSLPYALSWTSNLFFAFRSIDYFDELSGNDLFLHTWSLAVEEQFYLLWPLLILALPIGHALGEHAGHRRRIALFVAITLAAFVVAGVWVRLAPTAAYFLTPVRIWQFALGALVFVALEGRGATRVALAWTTLGAGLLAMLGTALLLGPDTSHSGLNALGASVGAALAIAAGDALARQGRRSPLADARLVWLGDRSYSLYLWHWPVLTLAAPHGVGDTGVEIAALMLLCLLLAMISYRCIELPFWKGRFSTPPPIRTFAIGIGAACLVFATSLHALKAPSSTAPTPDNPFRGLRLGIPVIYEMGCDAWYAHALVEPCLFGPDNASRTMVFIGDSIGAQWSSAFPALFPQPEWRFAVLTKSACAMVDEDYYYRRVGGVYEVCTRWRNDSLDWIAQLRPDVVIVGGGASSPFDERQWVEGSRRVLTRLSAASGQVILLGSTPKLGFNGPTCIEREVIAGRMDFRERCLSERPADVADAVTAYLRQAAEALPNVTVLDLNEIVCPGRVCSAVSREGIAVFRDGQHLSDGFVRARIPEIGEAFARVLNPP